MVTSSQARVVGKWRHHLFIAGHSAFEISNTIHYRHAPDPNDLITGLQDLADWSESVGLAQITAAVTTTDLARARALRATIYEVFSAIAAGREPPSAYVAKLLRTGARRFEVIAKPKLDAELAWQAVTALTTLPHERIGECPSCGWLFFDTSKGGRRRWCTMSVCGTREKVRAHRKRYVD